MLKIHSIIILLLLSLSACSLSPQPAFQYHPRFDFSHLKSYSFYPRNSSFSELQNLNSLMRNRVELSIEKRLDALGFKYDHVEKSDVIVSYYLLTPNKKKLQVYNQSVKYCRHCLVFEKGNENTKSWKSQNGSLLIDLVDRKSKRSVWRSIYPLKIQFKDTSREVQQRINDTVSLMFTENPKHIAGML